ncbi:MAG TPA: type II toxin-antitoxin system HicA family toxin, partial [Candidatus Bathyarchaeota archaeon]|nr:type II toxin-antitoxin system HicA family toxin [Candidatus Bathyarchaeota archaeon]
VVRIRGSHCKLKRTKMLVVPLHPELAKSTLKAILNEIELNEGIPQQVIRRLLRGEQVDISCPEKR